MWDGFKGYSERLANTADTRQVHGRCDVAVTAGVLLSIPMFSLELSDVHVKIKAHLAKR